MTDEEIKRVIDKLLKEEPSLIDNYLHPEKEILKKVYQDLLLKGKLTYRTRRLIFEHYEKENL